MKHLLNFLRSEEGAVTVDFVVLCSGVVAIAMVIAPMLSSPISNLAEAIGISISEYNDLDPTN
jgi:Flp pilus assembly pilin Flp